MDSEYDEDSSFKQRISKDLNTSGRSHVKWQTFKTGGGAGFPQYRVVLLCLGLLNIVLLIAALVLGIYCAKAKDLKNISDSALTPLIIERDFLRNHSNVIKERLDAQVALENQRNANMQLQIQVKHQETVIDSLQSQIEILRTEKTLLESNKTTLETSCGRCPLGWILLRSSCYHYSLSTNTKKNWPDSRADCITRGGDLLVIDNMEEQKVINKNYQKVTGVGSWWQMGFWMGLTGNATSGEWVWLNNVTENNTMYWRVDQPNRDASLAGHCAAFAINRSPVYWRSWYNRNCENDQLNWVCEMQSR